MKGTSKVIMGATLITVLSLAIVLGLILVFLAELYCSLLVRRRSTTSLELPTAAEASPITTQPSAAAAPPFSRFYSHGVIDAPRNFLFPSLASKEENDAVSDTQKTQHSQLRQFLDCSSKPRHSSATTSVRILSSKPPSPTVDAESHLQAGEDAIGSSKEHEHLVYMSNPMFDECSGAGADTPYATPDTSPSRLGNTSGSSDEDDETSTPQSNTAHLS